MPDNTQEIDYLKQHLADQIDALDQSAIVAITDPKGVISYVNPMFCALSEYTKEELIGRTHSVVNSGYHSPDFFKDMWTTIGRGKVWRGEVCNRAKSGRLYWVDTSIVPFVDNNSGRVRQYIAIRYDISEKKKTEALLEDERQRMIESEKMASIGLLTAGIAHELGNPLGAIRGRLEMLESMLAQDEFQKEFADLSVKKMIQSVDRMSKIIRSLKSYSRDGSKDAKQPFNLTELIADIIEVSVQKCSKNGIQVKTFGLDLPAIILGRETEIGQVVVNLFNNAFDAVKDQDHPSIEIHMQMNDDWCELDFFDSGPGVPEDCVGKIFDPFYTTKEVGQGTGLGLSISRSIIENHGGSLEYFYQDKTCFRIRLPKEGNSINN
jgi:PAS domain S-box-containing protein